MSKDKKQMAVMGVLVLVIVAVGAFQFMGGDKKPAAVVNEEPEAQAEGDIIAKIDEADSDPLGGMDIIFSELDKRDPFMAQAIILEEDDPQKQTNPVAKQPDRRTQVKDPIDNGGYGPVNPEGPDGPGVTPGRPAGEPPYDVVGLIQGSRSTMAVLKPDEGRQRMVSVGDSFSGMTIVMITADKVDVIYKGKTKTLTYRGG